MFTLKYEFNGYESSTLVQSPKTIEMKLGTDEANLDELCEFFGDFLKACSYSFDGQVGIVDSEGNSTIPRDDFENLIGEDLHDNENVDMTGYEPIVEDENPAQVQTEFNFNKEVQ